MTRTDPRGADRRQSGNEWAKDKGMDVDPALLERPAPFPHQPKRPAAPFYPDVNEYFYGGIVMARCARHAPPGARLYRANVFGAHSRCVTCVTPPVAEPVAEDA